MEQYELQQAVSVKVPFRISTTGLTIDVVISKDGAAFANPSAGATVATEIGYGWYYVEMSASDTDTLGYLIIRGTNEVIDPVEIVCKVVAVSTLGPGSGPVEHIYNLTVDSIPCADALVVMTTDLAGTNAIAESRTDASGNVSFWPDVPAGTTVYLWRYKSGVTFTNPDTEVTHV